MTKEEIKKIYDEYWEIRKRFDDYLEQFFEKIVNGNVVKKAEKVLTLGDIEELNRLEKEAQKKWEELVGVMRSRE